MIDNNSGGTEENDSGLTKRRSSLSLLEISNLRQLWSMRMPSMAQTSSEFMPGEVLPSLKNYVNRLSISGQGNNFWAVQVSRVAE